MKALILKNIESCKGQLNLLSGLDRFNTICLFCNGTTITSDESGYIITSKLFASQYQEEDAKCICESITNGNGEKAKPVSVKEYYQTKLEEFTELLKIL